MNPLRDRLLEALDDLVELARRDPASTTYYLLYFAVLWPTVVGGLAASGAPPW